MKLIQLRPQFSFLVCLAFFIDASFAQDIYLRTTLYRGSMVNQYNLSYDLVRKLSTAIKEGSIQAYSADLTGIQKLTPRDIDTLLLEAIDPWGGFEFAMEFDDPPTIDSSIEDVSLISRINGNGKILAPDYVFFSLADESGAYSPGPSIFSIKFDDLEKLDLQTWRHPDNEADSSSMINALANARYSLGHFDFLDDEAIPLVVTEKHPRHGQLKALADSLTPKLRKEPPIDPTVTSSGNYFKRYRVLTTHHPDNDYNIPFANRGKELIRWIMDETFSRNLEAYGYHENIMTIEEFKRASRYHPEGDFYEDDWFDDPPLNEDEYEFFLPSEMLFQLKYRFDSSGDGSDKRTDWLVLNISPDYNPAGFMQFVAQYRLPDLRKLIHSNQTYWYHPMNYNDSTDMISAIELGRLRTSEVMVRDDRNFDIFEALLRDSNGYWPVQGGEALWYIRDSGGDDQLLTELDTDSLKEYEVWIDSFIGEHWNDSTGFPPDKWHTTGTDRLVKFNYMANVFLDQQKNLWLSDIEFRNHLYHGVTMGSIDVYENAGSELTKAAMDDVIDRLGYITYEGEDEEETFISYTPGELYLIGLEGYIEVRGVTQTFNPLHFWYGIPAKKSVIGINEPKLALRHNDLLRFLKKHKAKKMKKAGKILRKDQYDFRINYIEDVYGRLVFDFTNNDLIEPAYYTEMVKAILKERFSE